MIENAVGSMRHNLALSFDIGLESPEFKLIGNLTAEEMIKYHENPAWMVIDNIAFKKIQGHELSYIVWWNGENFRYHTIVINDNRLMTGGQGPRIDANCVTVFPAKPFFPQLNKLKKELMEKEPDFRGFITFDVTATEKKMYYRYISFGIKADYIYAMSELSGLSVDEMIAQIENGSMKKPQGYGTSLRLYTYPFDFTSNYPIENIPGIRIGNNDMPIVTGRGNTIKAAWHDLYGKIPADIINHEVCYRTDGDTQARRTANFLFSSKKIL